MLNEGINRRDKPLYKKIKEIVKEQILSGKWAVGQCIPTEKELSEKFNVSRFTVRQSLLELTREGYLHRQAGKGTFVQPWKRTQEQKRVHSGKKQIGLVLPYEEYAHTGDIIKGVESEATALDYRVVFVNSDRADDEWEILNELYQEGIEGLIYYFDDVKNAEKNIIRLRELGFPFVLLDHYLVDIATDYVVSDNFMGAWQATGHLLELGHREIGLLFNNRSMTSVNQRVIGYRKALERAGLPFNEELVFLKDKKHITDEEIAEVLQNELTALFTTDLLASRVIKIATEMGIEIPKQLSVVGFDDIALSSVLIPALTTVRQKDEEMGREGVRILDDKIQGSKTLTQRVLSTSLVVRDSTAPVS